MKSTHTPKRKPKDFWGAIPTGEKRKLIKKIVPTRYGRLEEMAVTERVFDPVEAEVERLTRERESGNISTEQFADAMLRIIGIATRD